MRFYATILLALFLAEPAAAGFSFAEKCKAFYSAFSGWGRGAPQRNVDLNFPVDPEALAEAMQPEKRIEGLPGRVNKGLWLYEENGKRYFVKGLGPARSATEREAANAKAMHRLGIGPEVHAFADEEGNEFLLLEFVPGVNAKYFSANLASFGPENRPDWQAIARDLGLPATAKPNEIERAYFSELYKRKAQVVKRLREIRRALVDEGFARINDFQFMVNIRKSSPEVDIQVIDSAYFDRPPVPPSEEPGFDSVDSWIRSFELMRPPRSELR